jgi:hypothetical protein
MECRNKIKTNKPIKTNMTSLSFSGALADKTALCGIHLRIRFADAISQIPMGSFRNNTGPKKYYVELFVLEL